jgi:hypothetical protein
MSADVVARPGTRSKGPVIARDEQTVAVGSKKTKRRRSGRESRADKTQQSERSTGRALLSDSTSDSDTLVRSLPRATDKAAKGLKRTIRRLHLEGIRPLDNRLSAARYANTWKRRLQTDPMSINLAEVEEYLAVLKLTFQEYKAWVLTNKHMTPKWRLINSEMRAVGKTLKDTLADYNHLRQQARRTPIPALQDYVSGTYKALSQPD